MNLVAPVVSESSASAGMIERETLMTIRKTLAVAFIGATVAATTLLGATQQAAAGYYTPGHGFYGKPYVYVPPVYRPPVYVAPVYKQPKCFWETYRYRGPYGGWLTGRRWVCK